MTVCRYAVVGLTGSGKTRLAQALAERLGLPHIELDALFWGPNWQPAPREVFRARVAEALAGEAWVADGNFSAVRDLVWRRAQALVWLDYPLPLVLWRLTVRNWQRITRREELWGGNRESLRGQFLSRDSLYLYALKSYGRHRRAYPALLQQPEHSHLHVVRLRSPREARAWLARLPAAAGERANP